MRIKTEKKALFGATEAEGALSVWSPMGPQAAGLNRGEWNDYELGLGVGVGVEGGENLALYGRIIHFPGSSRFVVN